LCGRPTSISESLPGLFQHTWPVRGTKRLHILGGNHREPYVRKCVMKKIWPVPTKSHTDFVWPSL
jgi:hypothetical protein